MNREWKIRGNRSFERIRVKKCSRCGKVLRSDNETGLCSNCQHR